MGSYPVSIKGVLLHDGQAVLLKNGRGQWELPGGRLELGEEPVRTLTREFAEELALQVAVEAPIDCYLFEAVPGRHVFVVAYGCRLAGDFSPQLSDEHLEHCLCPVDRLGQLDLPAGYRGSIERWARSQPKAGVREPQGE